MLVSVIISQAYLLPHCYTTTVLGAFGCMCAETSSIVLPHEFTIEKLVTVDIWRQL